MRKNIRVKIGIVVVIFFCGLHLKAQNDPVLPIADGQTKFLGNIYSSSQAPGFKNYWNQVTPENGGKWGSVERTKDVMNWNDLDAAYKLAKDNGFMFKHHVLVWGSQQPGWMESLSASDQLTQIEEWFNAVANRYPDIDMIEVVNEALHQPPSGAGTGNYIGALGGSGSTGWDWVIEAFRMARQIFPNTQLIINDYGIINDGNAVNKYLTIINLLKKDSLIDGIGFQAHAFNTRGAASSMKANLDKLATAGLPLYATELDIDGASDQIQLNDYKRIFPVIWEHPAVQGITLWGYRPGLWRNTEKAYLINSNGSERPAMEWLRTYVTGADHVGVNDLSTETQIKVYPNPVTNKVVCFGGIENITSIRCFDLTGKQINAQNNLDVSEMQFNMNVNPGIYILQFQDETNTYFRKVVVK